MWLTPLPYKLARPRTHFFLASICHAITDPPVTKIRLWASWGVDQDSMPGTINNFFYSCFSSSKSREIIVWRSCPASQSIGRGRISREGALDRLIYFLLDHRESRERCDKIFAAKRQKTPKFSKKLDQENRFQWGISIYQFSFFWSREN